MADPFSGSHIDLSEFSKDEISAHIDKLSEAKDVTPLARFLDALGQAEGVPGHVAYCRVSSLEQNLARQVEALRKYQIRKWFVEKISGKDTARPQLRLMLDYVRDGDTVYIKEFSRLARNTTDLLSLAKGFSQHGIKLISDKENFDTSTPTGQLMLTMIAGIAEFERSLIRERQAEGIAIAKRAGKYKGRKRIVIPDFEKYYNAYMMHLESVSSLAKKLGVSRCTVYRFLNDYKSRDSRFQAVEK